MPSQYDFLNIESQSKLIKRSCAGELRTDGSCSVQVHINEEEEKASLREREQEIYMDKNGKDNIPPREGSESETVGEERTW